MSEKRTLKYKTIAKSEPAPEVGAVGSDKDTIFVKQISDTKADLYLSDSKGNVLQLNNPSDPENPFNGFREELLGILQSIEEIKGIKKPIYTQLISNYVGEESYRRFIKVGFNKAMDMLHMDIIIYGSTELVGQKIHVGTVEDEFRKSYDVDIHTPLGTLYLKKNGDVEFLVTMGMEGDPIRTFAYIPAPIE